MSQQIILFFKDIGPILLADKAILDYILNMIGYKKNERTLVLYHLFWLLNFNSQTLRLNDFVRNLLI